MKEISRYRLALIQYYLSFFLPKFIFGTQLGFCHHFDVKTFNFYTRLPILYSLKPKKLEAYWFPEGHLKPRIKLLKEAIKLCKNN